MTESSSLPSTYADEIDRARGDFETAWLAGQKPRIEGYLEGRTDSHRSLLLSSILAAELELRAAEGESPTADEYVARFPGDIETVRSLFEERCREHSATGSNLESPDAAGAPTRSYVSGASRDTCDTWKARADQAGSDRAARGVETDGSVGERIGRYRVIRLLGQGGFGRVYFARDDELGRHVAIKVTHGHLLERDLKPGNILIDADGEPHVTDFGMAVTEDLQRLKSGEIAGTPHFMAPEQVRGETHRLSAADLAADLRTWLAAGDRDPRGLISARAPAAAVESVPRVVPKGLRSFDVEDAEFFLTLLPGARDREGLPEPIRFWKTRIEEVDGGRTFSMGVIYGPSGCGKTSLVKAGLLPVLGEGVRPIYLEAAVAGNEARLLAGLRRECPGLPDGWSLTEAIAGIREGRFLSEGEKILIVLDQFEQWLHAHSNDPEAELTSALRQCDGRRVQGLILIRDDFWMSISRFMRALEVRLVEGRNSAAVELFDPIHARRVLAEFGRAWDRLPENPAATTAEQDRFLDRAIAELGRSHEGRIVPVRLGLFAEMVRGRPWLPATLKDVGGAEGLGVRFLEETFCGSSAPPAHRLHERAARAVLKVLLPESHTDLKGTHRSSRELMEAAGYGRRPEEFAELIRILDGELRLITPSESLELGEEPDSPPAPGTLSAREGHYQLAHDELVPSVRNWLTRKQQETRHGRAELRLKERSSFWNARPERRQLPSMGEWLSILVRTEHRDWTPPQKRMMWAATRRNLTAALVVTAVLCGATAGALALQRKVDRQQKAIAALGLIAQLRVADIDAVPAIIASLDGYRPWVDRPLAELAREGHSPQVRQRASLALLATDPSRAGAIIGQETIFEAEPEELAVLGRLLFPYRRALADRLWARAGAFAKAGDRHRLMRAGGLLALLGEQAAACRPPGECRDRTALERDPRSRRGLALAEADAGAVGSIPAHLQPGPARRGSGAACGTPRCRTRSIRPPRPADGARRVHARPVCARAADPLIADVVRIFHDDPDPGIHGAARCALLRWGAGDRVRTIDEELRAEGPKTTRGWYVNPELHTMVLVSPGGAAPGRATTPGIDAPFAIGDREVTVAQFLEFRPRHYYVGGHDPKRDCPINIVTWFDAAAYCRWLSEREDLPESEMCYPPVDQIKPGMVPYDNYLERTGYRLPTEAEWTEASRAGTTTPRYFGQSSALARWYAWYMDNADGKIHPVGLLLPNDLGLFDMLGNAYEWCQDGHVGDLLPEGDPIAARPISSEQRRALKGGWINSRADSLEADMHSVELPTQRYNSFSFRVARTRRPAR